MYENGKGVTYMKDKIYALLAISIFAICLWYFYQAAIYVINIFVGLPKEIIAPIIAGISVVLASLITVILGKYFERKYIVSQEQRVKRTPMYQELITFIFKLLPEKEEERLSESEQVEFIRKFTEMVLLWGSNEVIKEWSLFRTNIMKSSQSTDNLFLLENVLIAIRNDLGHKSSGIKKGDILRLFINDIDDYLIKK